MSPTTAADQASDPCAYVRRLWDDAGAYRRDYDELIGEELDFALKQDHYQNATGQTRDRRRVQPVGREFFGKLRHKRAQITKDRYLEVRPAQPLDPEDPLEAEVAKHVLTHELDNPRKCYRDFRKGVAMCGLAARIGVGVVDYSPEAEGLVFRIVDPRNFRIAPGWRNPHEIDCPWVGEQKRMRLSAVQKMGSAGWKNTADVKPDSGERQAAQNVNDPTLSPGQVRLSGSGFAGPRPPSEGEEPYATILCVWFRFDDSVRTRPRPKPRMLEPAQRYMACAACANQQPAPNGDGSALPEWGGICPQCLMQGQVNTMERIDAETPTDLVLTYPDGRLVICAPLSNVTLYDGPWPWRLRSVPFFFYAVYPHPIEPIGMSETAIDWSMVLLADSAKRFGYEQMMQSKRLFGMVDSGGRNTILNQHGQQWQFADEDGYVFYARSEDMLERGIREFQGAGLPAAWTAWNQTIQNELMRDMGTGDIDLTAQQLKGTPVGTINAVMETGEIPVDEAREDFQEAEGMFLGVVVDMCIATYTDEQLVEAVGEDGRTMFLRLRGSDIPEVHVKVTASPQMKKIAVGEAQEMLAILQAPPPYRRFLARQYNISPTDLARLEQDEAQWQQQQVAQMAQQQQMQIQQAQAMGAQPGAAKPPARNGNSRPAMNPAGMGMG